MRLIRDNNTILLIIDVQERLIKAVLNREEIVWNIKKLIRASSIMGLNIIFSEQNPEKLGKTIREIKYNGVGETYEKMSFSCCDSSGIMNIIKSKAKSNILICGLETHVCIQQTCIDLLSKGYHPYIAVDAISCRKLIDHEIALRKLESAGVVLSTTETAIFELCKTAERKEFKEISKIIKEQY